MGNSTFTFHLRYAIIILGFSFLFIPNQLFAYPRCCEQTTGCYDYDDQQGDICAGNEYFGTCADAKNRYGSAACPTVLNQQLPGQRWCCVDEANKICYEFDASEGRGRCPLTYMSSVPCAVTRVRYPNMCTETSTQPPPTEQDLVAIKREQQQQRAEEARLRAEKDRFKLLNPLDFDFTEDLKHGLPYGLGRIASWLLAFTGILAFLMFVWGGRLWLMSGGDPEKVKGGVDTMKWAAIGVILAFGSFMLLTFALELIRKQVG